jgi:hypothetical protein
MHLHRLPIFDRMEKSEIMHGLEYSKKGSDCSAKYFQQFA